MGSRLPKFTPRGQARLQISCPRQQATGIHAPVPPSPSLQFRVLPTVNKNACPVGGARRDSCGVICVRRPLERSPSCV